MRRLVVVIALALSALPLQALAQGPEPAIKVTGLVDHPYDITLAELTTLSNVTERAEVICVGWPPGGANSYPVYTYNWTGVTVANLIYRASPRANASYVLFHDSEDDYTSGLPLGYALDPKVIIAVQADGKPLDDSTGYPFRLVVPGWYGYKWVKFVGRIEVLDHVSLGTWENQGYSDIAIISGAPGTEFSLSALGVPLGVLGVVLLIIGVYMAGRPRVIDRVQPG